MTTMSKRFSGASSRPPIYVCVRTSPSHRLGRMVPQAASGFVGNLLTRKRTFFPASSASFLPKEHLVVDHFDQATAGPSMWFVLFDPDRARFLGKDPFLLLASSPGPGSVTHALIEYQRKLRSFRYPRVSDPTPERCGSCSYSQSPWLSLLHQRLSFGQSVLGFWVGTMASQLFLFWSSDCHQPSHPWHAQAGTLNAIFASSSTTTWHSVPTMVPLPNMWEKTNVGGDLSSESLFSMSQLVFVHCRAAVGTGECTFDFHWVFTGPLGLQIYPTDQVVFRSSLLCRLLRRHLGLPRRACKFP